MSAGRGARTDGIAEDGKDYDCLAAPTVYSPTEDSEIGGCHRAGCGRTARYGRAAEAGKHGRAGCTLARGCAVLLVCMTLVLAAFVFRLHTQITELRVHVLNLQSDRPDIALRGVCVSCTLLTLGSPEENDALKGLWRYPGGQRGAEAAGVMGAVDGYEECCARDQGQFETLLHRVINCFESHLLLLEYGPSYY